MKRTYPNFKLPFDGGIRITQFFGSNSHLYTKFGFDGHEGLDIIPYSGSWNIHAPEDGTIVRDTDHPRDFNNYGNLFVLLSTDGTRAWWFAHNAENYVSIGNKVEKGQLLAKMGGTGNVTGPHVHLGLRKAVGGKAINLDNGFKGFIDPTPFLIKANEPERDDMNSNCNKERDTWWTTLQTFFVELTGKEKPKSELYDDGNKEKAIAAVKEVTNKIRKDLSDYKKLLIKNDDVGNKLREARERVTGLEDELKSMTSSRDQYRGQVKTLKEEIKDVKESAEGSASFRLDEVDLNAWLRNVAVFTAPVILAYLGAVQGQIPAEYALIGIIFIQPATDILKRFIRSNKVNQGKNK